MKRDIFNKLLLACCFAIIVGMTSCEDYLTLYPTTSITKEDFWNTKNDVNNVRAAAYYQLTQCTGSILTWGEYRSDNVELNDASKTSYRYMREAVLQPADGLYNWAPLYKGINFCNEVLENGEHMVNNSVDPAFTSVDWRPMKAEMLSLRALYYFYLVRAFRNVPFVTHSVGTDAEALNARDKAVPGQVIMDSLINQVERALPYSASNYGSTSDNKGRWTTTSMQALLADMCLWRACMVMRGREKGFPVTNEKGDTLTAGQENTLSSELLKKSISYCNLVIKKLREDYSRRLDLVNVPQDDRLRKLPFPLLQYSASVFTTEDIVYSTIFGAGNSLESVLELQYDGVNVKNKTLSDAFYGNPDGGFKAGLMLANSALFDREAKVDPVKGYGKTDMRYANSGLTLGTSLSSSTPIIKGAARDVSVFDPKDIPHSSVSYELRPTASQDANWPIYRLSDIMTIKAEAISRLLDARIGYPDYNERDAYLLLDELFRRNNPAIDSTKTSSTEFSIRLRDSKKFAEEDKKEDANKRPGWKDRYAAYSGPLHLTFCERQREFLGEGKRWFDIVRECEFRGATKDVLSDWVGVTSMVRNRLRSIWSLYNPIYLDELKVNGRDYGSKRGQLVQNPAWEKYMH